MLIVGGGVTYFMVRGLVLGSADSFAKGVTVFGLGLGGFMVVALANNGHTAGAVAAGAVIVPMVVGGFALWFFMFRKASARTETAASSVAILPSHRLRTLAPVLFGFGAAVPGLFFATGLITHHHAKAGIATAVIMLLLISAILTVRQIIIMSEQESAKRAAARAARQQAKPDECESHAPLGKAKAKAKTWTTTGVYASPDPVPEPVARRSQVETRFVRMTLDHAAGTMTGEIIAGLGRGFRLDALEPDRLLDLLERWRKEDATTAVVVESWLDRNRPDWRDSRETGKPERHATMGREEALAVLGLKPDAEPSAVKDCHRRLMARIHPDQGGSTWLASKVNEARDTLLARDTPLD